MKEGDKVEVCAFCGDTSTDYVGRLISYGDSEVVIKTEDVIPADDGKVIVFNRRYVISITILEA